MVIDTNVIIKYCEYNLHWVKKTRGRAFRYYVDRPKSVLIKAESWWCLTKELTFYERCVYYKKHGSARYERIRHYPWKHKHEEIEQKVKDILNLCLCREDSEIRITDEEYTLLTWGGDLFLDEANRVNKIKIR